MSDVTIKLVSGVAGLERAPELMEHLGRWLTRYEPDRAVEGEQWLWTTDDRSKAARMPFEQAMDLIKKPVGIRPWDGKPDRPITVFNLEIARVEVEELL